MDKEEKKVDEQEEFNAKGEEVDFKKSKKRPKKKNQKKKRRRKTKKKHKAIPDNIVLVANFHNLANPNITKKLMF